MSTVITVLTCFFYFYDVMRLTVRKIQLADTQYKLCAVVEW